MADELNRGSGLSSSAGLSRDNIELGGEGLSNNEGVAPPSGSTWELNGGGGDWQLNGAAGDWELNT